MVPPEPDAEYPLDGTLLPLHVRWRSESARFDIAQDMQTVQLTRAEITVRYFQPFKGCFPVRTIRFEEVRRTAALARPDAASARDIPSAVHRQVAGAGAAEQQGRRPRSPI